MRSFTFTRRSASEKATNASYKYCTRTGRLYILIQILRILRAVHTCTYPLGTLLDKYVVDFLLSSFGGNKKSASGDVLSACSPPKPFEIEKNARILYYGNEYSAAFVLDVYCFGFLCRVIIKYRMLFSHW